MTLASAKFHCVLESSWRPPARVGHGGPTRSNQSRCRIDTAGDTGVRPLSPSEPAINTFSRFSVNPLLPLPRAPDFRCAKPPFVTVSTAAAISSGCVTSSRTPCTFLIVVSACRSVSLRAVA